MLPCFFPPAWWAQDLENGSQEVSGWLLSALAYSRATAMNHRTVSLPQWGKVTIQEGNGNHLKVSLSLLGQYLRRVVARGTCGLGGDI